jgi:DNA-binding transcriptional MerR regulator
MAGERLNAHQAAAHVGLSVRTVRNLQQQGLIPHVKVSARKIFYEPEELDRWFEARRLRAEDVPT